MPEEDPNKFFMISLIIQRLYQICFTDQVAVNWKIALCFTVMNSEPSPMLGRDDVRLTVTPDEHSECNSVPPEKNYGREEPPSSSTTANLTIAEVCAGQKSVRSSARRWEAGQWWADPSAGAKRSSQSLQMIERPPWHRWTQEYEKGRFIALKTGCNPFVSRLKLFFKWGICFDEKSIPPDKGARQVAYVSASDWGRNHCSSHWSVPKLTPAERRCMPATERYRW